MIQLIGLLLCVYLVFKGVEILQIALASTRDDRRTMMGMGIVALIGSIVVAGLFALVFLVSGINVPSRIP
jgi:hypothetical protein